jgi:hypothetical protein
MDTTKELIGLFIRLGISLAFITLVWFMISLVFPDLSITRVFKSITTTSTSTARVSVDWLPAPKNYGGLFGHAKTPTVDTNVYVPNAPYDGSANALPGTASSSNTSQSRYVVYTANGMMIQNADGTLTPYDDGVTTTTIATTTVIGTTTVPKPVPPNGDLRPLYLRNLSIFTKSAVYKNLTFTGEAREMMFDKSGKFPLIIIDNKGKGGVIGTAEATASWTVPGWIRFTAVVHAVLPKDVPCTLILQSATVQATTQMPLRFPYAVTCTN